MVRYDFIYFAIGTSKSFISTVLGMEEFSRSAINILGTITSLAGLYSATVFSIVTVYGKTALSQSPTMCLQFLDTTKKHRHRAFFAYIAALTCCGFQCVLALSMIVPSTNTIQFAVVGIIGCSSKYVPLIYTKFFFICKIIFLSLSMFIHLGLLFAYYQIGDIKDMIDKAALQIFVRNLK